MNLSAIITRFIVCALAGAATALVARNSWSALVVALVLRTVLRGYSFWGMLASVVAVLVGRYVFVSLYLTHPWQLVLCINVAILIALIIREVMGFILEEQ
jgi:hypothetical protein